MHIFTLAHHNIVSMNNPPLAFLLASTPPVLLQQVRLDLQLPVRGLDVEFGRESEQNLDGSDKKGWKRRLKPKELPCQKSLWK